LLQLMIDNYVRRKKREEQEARKAARGRGRRKKDGGAERVSDDQLFKMTGGIGVKKHGD